MGTLHLRVQLKGTFPTCEYPWIQIGPNYQCYLVSHDPLTYYAADQFCKQSGGYLAEPRSAEETEMLAEFCLPELNYWIGLTDLVEESKWVWGSAYSEPDYENWDSDNDANRNDGDCTIKRGHTDFTWWDSDCDNDHCVQFEGQNHALCQKDYS